MTVEGNDSWTSPSAVEEWEGHDPLPKLLHWQQVIRYNLCIARDCRQTNTQNVTTRVVNMPSPSNTRRMPT